MTAKRRIFAADSSVPVDRTRAEITALLQSWGCSAMGWTDHFAEGAFELGFVWDPGAIARRGQPGRYCPKGSEHRWVKTCEPCQWRDGFSTADQMLYRVRMKMKIGTDPQKNRTAHRLLLLKIKADLNAADAGLVKAEEAFLPWIVTPSGETLSEMVLPKLKSGFLALPAKAGDST